MASLDFVQSRPVGRRVQLMATCLCDAFFPELGRATVEVLESSLAGCDVEFPEGQTCCGQPPFNGGDFAASRKVVRHNVKVFGAGGGAEEELPIIIPSGSCAAMQTHGNGLQFENEKDRDQVAAMGRRSWELFDFLVNGLGLTQWPGRFEKRVALHHSCHTRGGGTPAAMRLLLGSIAGLQLVEFGEPEQCCGFGGTFSVTFPHISAEMGTVKLDRVLDGAGVGAGGLAPEVIASADRSCLMHLGGLAEKQGRKVETMHAVEILRAALNNNGNRTAGDGEEEVAP